MPIVWTMEVLTTKYHDFELLFGWASMKVDSRATRFAVLVCLPLAFLVGCSNRPRAARLPSVHASDVASFAMEHYDADHNGTIDARELTNCPPLAAALPSYDADHNGQLSAR